MELATITKNKTYKIKEIRPWRLSDPQKLRSGASENIVEIITDAKNKKIRTASVFNLNLIIFVSIILINQKNNMRTTMMPNIKNFNVDGLIPEYVTSGTMKIAEIHKISRIFWQSNDNLDSSSK